MRSTTIDHSGHPLYDSFKKIYSVSFPIFEQRTEEQQENAFSQTNYHLIGYEEEENVLIGFISYWEFNEYVYIEHFAVNKDFRDKGYGSKILQDFIASVSSKIVLLEIDPIVGVTSAARLWFYKKCGFNENPYPHTHPPYRKDYDAHSLIVLTTKRQITEEEYRAFYNDLTDIVMA